MTTYNGYFQIYFNYFQIISPKFKLTWIRLEIITFDSAKNFNHKSIL